MVSPKTKAQYGPLQYLMKSANAPSTYLIKSKSSSARDQTWSNLLPLSLLSNPGHSFSLEGQRGTISAIGPTTTHSGFLNRSRCMGENTPDSPPCTRLSDTFTSISCTSYMPLGAMCSADTTLTRALLTVIRCESRSHLSRPYLQQGAPQMVKTCMHAEQHPNTEIDAASGSACAVLKRTRHG